MPIDDGSTNQISFFHEVVRKTTHMCALVIPGGYYLLRLDQGEALTIMVPVTALMLFIDVSRLRQWRFWTAFARRIGGALIRHHEMQGDFTGASYILLSSCLTIALYDKPIAVAALTFIIVGDSFAAIIGRKFGRHRFYRSKTIEGTLGCLLGTLVVAILLPDMTLSVAVGGAVVATAVEAYPFGVDDNIAVPLISGLFMTLAEKLPIFL